MKLRGPILLIEDDANDADVVKTAIAELDVKNEIKVFSDAREALDYLMTTTDQPLIILCDIRMPGLDGMSLLKHIQRTEYLKQKAIPFVMYTGIATQPIVKEAYNNGVQGFYKKAADYAGIKEQLYCILMYWTRSLHPNSDWS